MTVHITGLAFLIVNATVAALGFHFFHLILRSYDYNIHVESLLPASLCLVTLLNS